MKRFPVMCVLAVPFSLAVVACSSSGAMFNGSGGSTGSAGSAGSASSAAGSGAPGAAAGSSGAAAGSSGAAAGASSGGSGTTAGGAAGASAAAGTGGAATGGAAGASGASGGASAGGAGGGAASTANFFVSSDTSMTANLGGLSGADARCQRLAAAVGLGGKTWHAYLSAVNPPTNARDRIGEGPYYNVHGAILAATKAALHARTGDAQLFITEQGNTVNGQWNAGPPPWTNQHDILTGTNADGSVLATNTCGDWTATTGMSTVGHSDGTGPNMSTAGALSSWNSSHAGQCGNTTPGGGAGRIYCFVAP